MTPALPALLNPILVLLGLGLGIGAMLGAVARAFRLDSDPVVETINNLLPQTQCGQCGYPGCRPYAVAIADGDAINKCPPGGEQTIGKLAALLNVQVLPLDTQYGVEEERKVAFIREAECIGCAKCLPACPVDAILGAPKFMHTVIESECTGCDLCVDPCPVDCIDMIPANIETSENRFAPVPEQHYQACINCGLCIDECPVDILPHELYWACQRDELEKAQSLKLMHCIECGKCNDVCPSRIPLVACYQNSKQKLKQQQDNFSSAEQAKRRFEIHQRRMQKLAEEEERRRVKRAKLANADRQQVSQENIRAALARVEAKKDRKQTE